MNWADVIEQSQIDDAVYAIGLIVEDGRRTLIGSGFAAYYNNVIWTNAHVITGLEDRLAALAHLNPIPIAVRSGTAIGGSEMYALISSEIHPDYDGTLGSPDIGLFALNVELPASASLLPREMASQLRVGQPIATLGFPGELQLENAIVPIATLKDGVISALRPLQPDGIVSAENNRRVQHNFDTTGGTSGSLIFDHLGWVIAVHYSGFGVGSLSFGIRIDEVWNFIGHIASQASSVADRAPGKDGAVPVAGLSLRRYPHSTYQAFPEDWNGQTIQL